MKKQKIRFLFILAVILVLIIFFAIYFTTQNKYNNHYLREFDSYKTVNLTSEEGSYYYETLNNYYDYEQDILYSMYIFGESSEEIYKLLGNIKIKSKAQKTSDAEKSFDITFTPTYPADRITFQFHGDNIVIDGEEYKTEGLDALRNYITLHTLTIDDIITYVSEDKETITEAISKAWKTDTATSTDAVRNSLPKEASESITAKLYFSYYLSSTTGSGIVHNYYPIDESFYFEYGSIGGYSLCSTKNNVEPLLIENNPDEVRKFIEDNK
ncbi:MAG: hypothetical protein IJ141_04145 [Lachnospiraceae bacterium]|nr:hypothetical protein [Lachnospiraceae bacterium]